MSDIELAFTRLRAILGEDADPDAMAYIVHNGPPLAKSGAASPARLAKRLARLPDRPWKGNIALVATFYRPNLQRIDTDNLMKLVMDAGTRAGAWLDDSQVTAQAAFIELDEKHPRTVIAMCPGAISSMNRSRTATRSCAQCGTTFEVPNWDARRRAKYCSLKCARTIQRTRRRCLGCGVEFIPPRSGHAGHKQRYCSVTCRNRSPRNRYANRLPLLCPNCGGRISRREYTQCSSCRRRGRPARKEMHA